MRLLFLLLNFLELSSKILNSSRIKNVKYPLKIDIGSEKQVYLIYNRNYDSWSRSLKNCLLKYIVERKNISDTVYPNK